MAEDTAAEFWLYGYGYVSHKGMAIFPNTHLASFYADLLLTPP